MTCPTCGRDGCPHAGAPVSPAGDLARLREENERLKEVVDSLRMTRDDLVVILGRIRDDNQRLRRRVETLELQRGI